LALQFGIDLLVDWCSARMTYDEQVHSQVSLEFRELKYSL
jgi:hypothetical protein